MSNGFGLLRRRNHLACPDCGLRYKDAGAAKFGFCDRCLEFTGMCGAGRRVICPDMMTMTTWHIPCTQRGELAWQITQDDGPHLTLLCETHDAQVRYGVTPWITVALPLDRGDRRVG